MMEPMRFLRRSELPGIVDLPPSDLPDALHQGHDDPQGHHRRDGECFAAILFLLIYGVLGGAVVIGVLLALRQRLKEIKGGEEDDAAQY